MDGELWEDIRFMQQAMSDEGAMRSFRDNMEFIAGIVQSEELVNTMMPGYGKAGVIQAVFCVGYLLGRDGRVKLDDDIWGEAFDE